MYRQIECVHVRWTMQRSGLEPIALVDIVDDMILHFLYQNLVAPDTSFILTYYMLQLVQARRRSIHWSDDTFISSLI